MPPLPLTDRRRAGRGPVPPVAETADGRFLHVLEVEIERRPEASPLVPPASAFTHFAIDERTAALLEKLATAVRLREPCLLEGETSTSKTSSIEYLAMRSGNPLVRINLSGQTDTSDLIGKFVPNDGLLASGFGQLVADTRLLKDASREIVERARREGRGLSLVESQRIAKEEELSIPDWRWQNGAVPEAMEKGQWLILDEVNLAEPQILERLNPVLEKHPSLTVPENGGATIGRPGGPPVHPGFRIFATMNPAETSGRSPLSPAYKDRFTAYKYVPAPAETEYAQMLTLMVFGEIPSFRRNGVSYGGDPVDSRFPKLKAIQGMRGFLAKLARFHATAEGMARRREIGREGRERLVFTRRTLIEFLAYLEDIRLVNRASGGAVTVVENPKDVVLRALGYFYTDKLARDEDIQKLNDQLDAIGISERQWHHEFSRPPAPPPPRPAPPPPPPPVSEPPAPAPAAPEAPDPAPAVPRRQFIPDALGNGTFLLTSRAELGPYRTGQKLRPKPAFSSRLPERISGSTKFEIAGFTSDDKVVIEIEDGAGIRLSPLSLGDRFDPVEDEA
ncbi:MAG: AAA family ATPase [Acidobacteria bacterium]|nr:AAA family ATPase [Acidobacteriota bacterium]